MRQNFIQLDFVDINDAVVGKNIIVRFINKDGKHTEFVHLQELRNLVDDVPSTHKQTYQSPPDTIRKNLLVCMINNISGERFYQVIRNVSSTKILIDVASPVAGCIIPFEWNGTMYVSATKDEDCNPIYRLEI